jgi:tRNA dimethylallyltransferase
MPENSELKDKQLIVIGGPTASGKTAVSVALAKQLSCPILSVDSRQFYKEMSIGTAKPTHEEMQGIQHFFIDSHSIEEEISAGQFGEQARGLITELFQTTNTLIAVGGSGLFIKTMLEGIDDLPGDQLIREKWNKRYQEKGVAYLQEELRQQDPDYYREVDQHNHMRLIRALEVIEITGLPFSQQRKHTPHPLPCRVHYFVINHDRAVLYDRINQRVINMMYAGLLEEVKSLIPYRDKQSLNTVGYKELFAYMDGTISLDRAVELIQQNSRRYAKRQLTWFKGIGDTIWLNNESTESAAAYILEQIKK